MSGLQLIRKLDNRLNLNNERFFESIQGCAHINYQRFPQQSLPISNSISISVNPSNRNIAVVREAEKIVKFRVTVTGTTTVGELLQPNCHAPSAFPILAVTDSENFEIGQANPSQTQASTMWKAMMRYNNERNINNYIYSKTPSQLDNTQDFGTLLGTNRSVFANYGDNTNETPRGAYYNYTIISNDEKSAVVEFEVVEPVFLSPFVFGAGAKNMQALIGIETMRYGAQFGNLSLCWSADKSQNGTGDITGVSVQILSFAIGITQLTPQLVANVPRTLLSSYYWPYYISVTASSPLLPDASVQLPSIRVQLTGIPKRIYLFATESTPNLNSFTPATFLSLADNVGCVRVSVNGVESLNQHDRSAVYSICRNNGVNLDYSQFSSTVGSPVGLDWARDIGSNPEQSEALSQMNEVEMSMTVKNTSLHTIINPTFHAVVVYSGIFSVVDGVTYTRINPLTSNDILNAPTDISEVEPDMTPNDVYGGSFLGSLRNVATKAHKFIKDNRVVSRVAGLMGQPEIAAAASAFGYGESGGGVTGGRVMSRNKLLTMGRRF